MANYLDNSQFSCRFCEADPFKATTSSLNETTKQWTLMGLANRHPEKSNTLQENTCRECLLGKIIFHFVSKRQRQTLVWLWNIFFKCRFLSIGVWGLGGPGGVGMRGHCLRFYKSEKFKCGNPVLLITSIMKNIFSFSVLFPVWFQWLLSHSHMPLDPRAPARKNFSTYTTFTTLCSTHLCGLKLIPPKVLYLQNKTIALILSFLIVKRVLPDMLYPVVFWGFVVVVVNQSCILTKQLAGLYSQSCSSHIGYIRCIINMSFKRLS